ncbi:hypothetical protein SAMN05443574_103310 [Haloarcula vallismortis]|uniref:Helicase HerA central domain-containing protein n=2 Tax=Haloarcula vallismortis TaxID=28442 RepID=A0A1H2TN95_HALVA|nr:DUF87 domain-containing protein [Haloarcula vallismortis]EMA11573.1 putative ATP-binding protein [Haloarcula vallismortis ATCC 29715]SDW45257.1 hypothetical protein SAMN05443574_103310 [Haloarcula vallismortis]
MANTQKLLRLIKENNLQHHPQIQKLLEAGIATDNDQKQKTIRKLIELHAAKQLKKPFTETTPDTSLLDKPIILGKTRNHCQTYAIPEESLTRHILTNGATGTGKTTLHLNILNQLTTPYWIFDRKQDYRHLTQQQDNLLVLPWHRVRFNPLQPPQGVGPAQWAMSISEILSHSTDLLSGSRNYVLTHIIELYKQYNLFDEHSSPYPTLLDLEELIQSDKVNYVRKTSNYRDTVLSRLEPMTEVTRPVFNCSRHYPYENLIQRNMVFEFEGLDRDIQNFIQESIFAYLYHYLSQNGFRGKGLHLVLVWDEAKKAFSYKKEQSDAAGIPEMDDLTAKAREFGLSLMVSDQESTKLTESIKANTETKVLLRPSDYNQLSSMADSMGLDELQRSYAFNLDVGQAIVKHAGCRPVPVDTRDFDLDKNVSDEDLRRSQEEQWESLDYSLRDRDPLEKGSSSGSEGVDLSDYLKK